MDVSKYVIIGGGVAAGRACQGIRREDKAGSLTLVTAESHVPYQRPPLSKEYLRGEEGLDEVYLRGDAYYEENDVTLLRGTQATRVDPSAHTVSLDSGQVLEYEKLLLATGSRAWRLPIPGNELENVFTLRTIENSDAIREAAKSSQHVLVLGGSFIGSEVAASLTQLGAKVTMVFPDSRLLERIISQELSAYLHEMYARKGIEILTGTKPDSIEGDGRVRQVRLDSGQALDVDMVVMGVGIRLNTELARDAGLEMSAKGEIMVNEFLRTSDSDIYAAGDIAAWPDPTFDKRLRVEHWDVAYRQGLRVGRNMAGNERRYTTVPYFFSDLFDFSCEVWGDLTAWDQTIRRGSLKSGSFAYYYFNQGRMVGVLTVDRPDAERDPMQSLVKARPSYDDVAARLCNEDVDLETLLG
jgi:3-phenylpropionate/trans-cinnamate dioxygenase ferredoxin reductase subunit